MICPILARVDNKTERPKCEEIQCAWWVEKYIWEAGSYEKAKGTDKKINQSACAIKLIAERPAK